MMQAIQWENSAIRLSGSLDAYDILNFARALFVVCESQGYRSVQLDFTKTMFVTAAFMVPAIALIRKRRHEGVDFDLVLPENATIKSLFHNANWAHLIDDQHHEATTYDGTEHLPASVFRAPSEQASAVDRVMAMIVGAIALERKQLQALEWALNEITDNVINHANCVTGGVVQSSTITNQHGKFVEFVVADAGDSIPVTLKEKNHVLALEKAIQEGVTRNKSSNQGNGLFGSFRISTLSRGKFEIISGKARLTAESVDKVHARTPSSAARYQGTCVVCRIGCDDQSLIENALLFGGKTHQPGFDYLEKKYEDPNADVFNFKMREECTSFGSRQAGIAARNKLETLLKAEANHTIRVDFDKVSIVSSSFADEVFGRLFVMFGPMAFMSRFNFMNLDPAVRAVVDRAIMLRSKQEQIR